MADSGDYFRLAYPSAGYVDHNRLLLDHERSHVPVFMEGDLVVLERRDRGTVAQRRRE